MVFERLEEGSPNDEPEVCTTIEEVGSTGVGSLTIAFIILVICGCCFPVSYTHLTLPTTPYV